MYNKKLRINEKTQRSEKEAKLQKAREISLVQDKVLFDLIN